MFSPVMRLNHVVEKMRQKQQQRWTERLFVCAFTMMIVGVFLTVQLGRIPWFFKSQQSDDKRPRLDGGSDGASVSQLPVAQSSTPLHRFASPVESVTGQDNQDVNIADNDETILAEVMECLNDGGT